MFDKAAAGVLDVNIRRVVCNRPGAKVIERAARVGVPALTLDHTSFPDRESFDRSMAATLQDDGVELVVLAGYMRLLTPYFLEAFAGRVLNIHPALLPSFPGRARRSRRRGLRRQTLRLHGPFCGRKGGQRPGAHPGRRARGGR